jgi:NAD(P)-dependent dehydrogenase (short-subunit alcohol dehydrogenase family)
MSGKPVCAIVGIGPGLGAALARRFAAGGCTVLGFSRDPGRLNPEPGVMLRRADAADAAGLSAALTEGAAAAGGPVEVLIYNAYRSTMSPGGPSTLDPAEVLADLQVNVVSALAAAQAVLPGMLSAGRGSILFTGGGLALEPTAWLPAASLAIGKSGLRSLAFTLHAELAPRGVHAATVTVAGRIEPGAAFDPDAIAAVFWSLHADPPGRFRREIIFDGRAAS